MSVYTYLIVFCAVALLATIMAIIIFRKAYPLKIKKETRIDISLEQMKNIENEINILKRNNHLSANAGIYEIANALNVIEGQEVSGIHGKARIKAGNSDGYKIVNYAPRISRTDRIFAFAHECGHVINGDVIPNSRQDGQGKSTEEQLADYAAAAIIMPFDSIESILVESNFINLDLREKMDIVYDLCRKYSVSEVTAIKRINEVFLLMSN